MPKDLEGMCQTSCSKLSHPKTRPVVIFIDALNQVNELLKIILSAFAFVAKYYASSE